MNNHLPSQFDKPDDFVSDFESVWDNHNLVILEHPLYAGEPEDALNDSHHNHNQGYRAVNQERPDSDLTSHTDETRDVGFATSRTVQSSWTLPTENVVTSHIQPPSALALNNNYYQIYPLEPLPSTTAPYQARPMQSAGRKKITRAPDSSSVIAENPENLNNLNCPHRHAQIALGIEPPYACTGLQATKMSEVRRHMIRGSTAHVPFLRLCPTCNEDFLDQTAFEDEHGYKGEKCTREQRQKRGGAGQLEQWNGLLVKVKEMLIKDSDRSPRSNESLGQSDHELPSVTQNTSNELVVPGDYPIDGTECYENTNSLNLHKPSLGPQCVPNRIQTSAPSDPSSQAVESRASDSLPVWPAVPQDNENIVLSVARNSEGLQNHQMAVGYVPQKRIPLPALALESSCAKSTPSRITIGLEPNKEVERTRHCELPINSLQPSSEFRYITSQSPNSRDTMSNTSTMSTTLSTSEPRVDSSAGRETLLNQKNGCEATFRGMLSRSAYMYQQVQTASHPELYGDQRYVTSGSRLSPSWLTSDSGSAIYAGPGNLQYASQSALSFPRTYTNSTKPSYNIRYWSQPTTNDPTVAGTPQPASESNVQFEGTYSSQAITPTNLQLPDTSEYEVSCPYGCGTVLKGMYAVGNLTRHMKSRKCPNSLREKRDFPCPHGCDRSYARSDGLMVHLRKHHGAPPASPRYDHEE